MDAAFGTRASLARWPAIFWRWGVTPAVAALWACHELLVGAAAVLPSPAGPNHATAGLPWMRGDVGWYLRIAQASYAHLPAYNAAYFPGLPAYLWLTHWPALALLGMQVVFLALLVQVGRLAAAWGLAGWRVIVAQALVALAPAAVFYSTAYPECWEALGLCGALLAMKAGRPWRAAMWAALAGVVDPLGLMVGVGAGLWVGWSFFRRDWAGFRDGIAWGLGSVAALAMVAGVLLANGQQAFGFIGAQRVWGAHWLIPGVQIWQAIFQSQTHYLYTTIASLAIMPVVISGSVASVCALHADRWRASMAWIGVVIIGITMAFYTNYAPLSSAIRFVSLDIPAAIALAGVVSRRSGFIAVAWGVPWCVLGASLFTHGWFWG